MNQKTYKVERLALIKMMGQEYELLLNSIKPFGKVSLHYHKEMKEIFIFLGKARLQLGTNFIEMKKNDMVVISPMREHSIQAGGGGCKLIVFRFPYKKNDRFEVKQ